MYQIINNFREYAYAISKRTGTKTSITHNKTTVHVFIIYLAAPLIKDLIDLTFHHSCVHVNV